MSNLTPDELARFRLKAKHGMLTAEERAALEAYEAAAARSSDARSGVHGVRRNDGC